MKSLALVENMCEAFQIVQRAFIKATRKLGGGTFKVGFKQVCRT